MSELVLMPKELTAENGAKALLSGEFYETSSTTCPECMDGDNVARCPCCEGVGEINQRVYVSWTTIKDIYHMAVKNLAAKNKQ